MTTNKQILSERRIRRIRTQGYKQKSKQEISDLAFGNRFAYQVCTALLTLGVVLADIPILSLMMTIAFLGVILNYHPFDYIYNHVISERLGKPKLPPRSPQLKFACAIATAWIGTTIYLFYHEYMLAGYIMGALLITIALLVSTIDLCIPSVIYNALFDRKQNSSNIKFN